MEDESEIIKREEIEKLQTTEKVYFFINIILFCFVTLVFFLVFLYQKQVEVCPYISPFTESYDYYQSQTSSELIIIENDKTPVFDFSLLNSIVISKYEFIKNGTTFYGTTNSNSIIVTSKLNGSIYDFYSLDQFGSVQTLEWSLRSNSMYQFVINSYRGYNIIKAIEQKLLKQND